MRTTNVVLLSGMPSVEGLFSCETGLVMPSHAMCLEHGLSEWTAAESVPIRGRRTHLAASHPGSHVGQPSRKHASFLHEAC